MTDSFHGCTRFGLTPNEMDIIWNIMVDSFPPEERRNQDGMDKAMQDPLFHLLYRRDDKGQPAAFLTYWNLDNFRFVEHFAVSSSLRGQGIGAAILQEFLKQDPAPVILEVEPPQNEWSRRRIGFYQRLGFLLNNYPYFQPSLQPGMPSIPLQIMSAPAALSPTSFEQVREELYSKVYRRRPNA